MEHPFSGDLSELSIEDLNEKISVLNKNLNFTLRSGRYEVAGQIQMLLQSYRAELNKQQRALLDDDEALTGKIDIS